MGVTVCIPPAAEEIIEKLNRNGFEAYVVGGCVRDSLMGRRPEDWDITTSARPAQVKAIFGRTVDTGIRHGTVTIMRGRTGYEVTTYRIDGEYEDGRHPSSVEFTSDLREDLRRRDFTINAMAYNRRDGLVDIFGGLRDIELRRIRCVGDAGERFTEDALRILRALRFSAQLDFEIEPETEAAMKALAPNLVHVSRERIASELTKLLLSDHPDRVGRVFTAGAGRFVSETFAKISPEKIRVENMLPAEKGIRWAAFLRHESSGDAVRILEELKMDNDTINRVRVLVEYWDKPVGKTQEEIRRTMSRIPPGLYDSLLELKRAAAESGEGEETSEELEYIREQTRQIRERGDCVGLKTLAVTGADLIGMGMKPGRELGRMLERLLDLVIVSPERNTADGLLAEAKRYLAAEKNGERKELRS